MYNYAGKRAIVTGAAHGIGKAIAMRLAGEGCAVALWDVNQSALQSTLAELKEGSGHTTQVVDVSDLDAVRAASAATTQAWGAAPDVLVNNAGIGRLASILDVTPADFDRTMEVNVGGTFNCCHVLVPAMRDAGGGNIVNMASWFGKSGRPNSLAYCASKFAIIGMTQSMAIDLAAHRIRVNAVCPGTIDNTEMRKQADETAAALGLPSAAERQHLIPLQRLGQPEDIARAVAFLISDEASYMTGQSINVTGGLWMN
ncbi:SDR family oxidoreductase [Rhodopseudomonas sp. HC1]|uniref:SDR family NAD(P)-dependent oxidoreductase n=1 Tax=Rhodopseudomonas infernalis TaxID=2897386 RepID=UPI001EE8C70B|nr:SDR family NAD(P)-dependent oxidoreductase [Rhodopseudomonas infernalis]MCG6205999.1 SDR family oxidoreductase [Rhodopseudomonas infernalis]